MTTRADLRDDIMRERLADATQWPDSTLNQWIEDAIAEYSVHFPRTDLEATIDCVDDQREYDLSSELTRPQGILRVEYPSGEDPPEYLTRRSVDDSRGFWGGEYYDVRGDPPHTLFVGEKPDDGEDIVVFYDGDHLYPTDDADMLTVPDQHLEGLVLFVWWKAAQELLAAEAKDPQTTTLLLTQFDMLTYRAAREYRYWLRDVKGEHSPSMIVSWGDIGL